MIAKEDEAEAALPLLLGGIITIKKGLSKMIMSAT